MTYRERRLAKAARYQEWAAKREAKAEIAYNVAHKIIDQIPAGQPILVGHHSERRHRNDLKRHDAYMHRSIEDGKKADEMRSKADNIVTAASNAIYNDDPDAVEQLTAKIARLEAERDGIKAYDKSARAGKPDISVLTDEWQKKLDSYVSGADQIPGFALANLNGNINRLRKRLNVLQRRAQINTK